MKWSIRRFNAFGAGSWSGSWRGIDFDTFLEHICVEEGPEFELEDKD